MNKKILAAGVIVVAVAAVLLLSFKGIEPNSKVMEFGTWCTQSLGPQNTPPEINFSVAVDIPLNESEACLVVKTATALCNETMECGNFYRGNTEVSFFMGSMVGIAYVVDEEQKTVYWYPSP
jgi:hypothetical protein